MVKGTKNPREAGCVFPGNTVIETIQARLITPIGPSFYFDFDTNEI